MENNAPFSFCSSVFRSSTMKGLSLAITLWLTTVSSMPMSEYDAESLKPVISMIEKRERELEPLYVYEKEPEEEIIFVPEGKDFGLSWVEIASTWTFLDYGKRNNNRYLYVFYDTRLTRYKNMSCSDLEDWISDSEALSLFRGRYLHSVDT